MNDSYRFFENRECEYFPCHEHEGPFNCLFCFCPMYSISNCPGNPEYITVEDKRIKSCEKCTFPHEAENYDKIMKVLSSQR